MNGTAPHRAASRGMCVAVASMPMLQAAATIPMVSLSWPWRSSAIATSGRATPPCRPDREQATKSGSRVRQAPVAATARLVGDTQVPLGAERGRLVVLDQAFGLAGGFLLAAPHIGIEAVARQ